MAVTYLEQERIFRLDTPNTTYLMGIVGTEGFLGHIYYGKKLRSVKGAAALMRTQEYPYTPDENARDRVTILDCFPTEYSGHGVGDYRESCVKVRDRNGSSAVHLTYVSHEIYQGKRPLKGLPATFGTENEVTTLVIHCEDKVLGLCASLSYSVFEDTDAIARSVLFENRGSAEIYLDKAMSGCLDMDNRDFEALTMHGGWARERHMERRRLGHGKFRISTLRGETSHQEQPFLALLTQGTTQTQGEVYAFHFVYSGNFMAQAEISQFDSVRVVMGINPEDFCWKLEQGERFQTPEMILVYSAAGLGEMTRSFHALYRGHLIRSPYLHKRRPILINNWEGTYFDFDEKKLIEIATESAKLGIEMLVMDDGWFGNRFDDNRGLGDWYVNEEKLKGGLKFLADQVNALGMKFGMWFEPEMVSEESRLYKEHPDWAFAIPNRKPARSRNQYVLDIGRREVRDYIMERVTEVIRSANVEYVKWDMNRPLTDLFSAQLPADRQGEIYHRYVLGMYEMQERLTEEFPDLLLENCSGGGGRFDPGMLYYSPQIWCSDDADAIERLSIQESTAMLYDTRGYVALAGTFGYELDITKLEERERAMVKRQTAMYHRFNDLVREGIYYRIASYQENHSFDCFQVNDAQGRRALVFYTQVLFEPNRHSRFLRLQGLLPEADYRIYQADMETDGLLKDTGKEINGSVLTEGGLAFEQLWGDFRGGLFYLEALGAIEAEERPETEEKRR